MSLSPRKATRWSQREHLVLTKRASISISHVTCYVIISRPTTHVGFQSQPYENITLVNCHPDYVRTTLVESWGLPAKRDKEDFRSSQGHFSRKKNRQGRKNYATRNVSLLSLMLKISNALLPFCCCLSHFPNLKEVCSDEYVFSQLPKSTKTDRFLSMIRISRKPDN